MNMAQEMLNNVNDDPELIKRVMTGGCTDMVSKLGPKCPKVLLTGLFPFNSVVYL